ILGNAIITITDEGDDKGSITLPQMTTPPSSIQYKLYNENGTLKYNGTSIGSGGGAPDINDLSDAKYDGSSLFLGEGSGALDDGTDNNNTAIGKNTLQANTTGNNNTAAGNISMFSNTTGSGNSAYGFLSLNTNTTGNNNTAIGSGSLWFNETGNANTAIGYNSLSGNVTGEGNTANGVGSLRSNSTGNANTANGNGALFSNTIGSYNIGIGSEANSYNQTGSYNTIIGFQAGQGTSVHNKSGNIFLGYQAGFNETSDNKLYIENSNSSSPLIWGDFENDSLRFNGNVHITGNLHVDGTSPNLAIGDSYQGGKIFWLDNSGEHGLIVALFDQSAGMNWSTSISTTTGATGDGVGAGLMNSVLIIASNASASSAAKVCADYAFSQGGIQLYGDWYLPSPNELRLLHNQKAAVGGVINYIYWSSQESSFSQAKAVDMAAGTFAASTYLKSTSTIRVRAIRKF
ncbi:MAG: hypothetical protein KDC67_08960, partial [Ignavibacteriae bacterium]|nr:hypothetical protein [Ignavibacteriota bacterium]